MHLQKFNCDKEETIYCDKKENEEKLLRAKGRKKFYQRQKKKRLTDD